MNFPTYGGEISDVTCRDCPMRQLTEEFWQNSSRDPIETALMFEGIRNAVAERSTSVNRALLEIDNDVVEISSHNTPSPYKLTADGLKFAACLKKQTTQPCVHEVVDIFPDMGIESGVNVLRDILDSKVPVGDLATRLREQLEEIVLGMRLANIPEADNWLSQVLKRDDREVIKFVVVYLQKIEDINNT